jgi:hypothetical protein
MPGKGGRTQKLPIMACGYILSATKVGIDIEPAFELIQTEANQMDSSKNQYN